MKNRIPCRHPLPAGFRRFAVLFGIVLSGMFPPARAAAFPAADGNVPQARIRIHAGETTGRIRPVNGGNLAPPLEDEEQPGEGIREAFRAMNVPITRLHDAPLENPGMRLVDMPLIFANETADTDDPGNYYFAQTDDYIRGCIECGTAVYYRLGTSIEHGSHKYFTHPPKDIRRWIDIASNIIRHYTEGKWNGFHYDIRYWEIWNEPDLGPKMWTGTLDEFNAFYAEAAAELKKRFPHLKFGGPAHCVFEPVRTGAFLESCARRNAPLDFYSYHMYAPDDRHIVESPAEVRELLDSYGYTATEIHLNEWHYNPQDGAFWAADPQRQAEMMPQMRGTEAAAFLNTVMIGWQDTPLDIGFYYTVSTTRWGVFENRRPLKSYYGMKAFGEIIRYGDRLRVTADSLPAGSRVLAGRNGEGDVAVLVACWKSGPMEIAFDVDPNEEFGRTAIYLLDETRDLEKTVEFSGSPSPFRIRTVSPSSVVLIRIEKKR